MNIFQSKEEKEQEQRNRLNSANIALTVSGNISMIGVALAKTIVEDFLNDMFDKDIITKKQYSEYRDKALEMYNPERSGEVISKLLLKK